MPVSLGLVRYFADFPSLRTTMQQVFACIRCVPHKVHWSLFTSHYGVQSAALLFGVVLLFKANLIFVPLCVRRAY